MSKSLLLIVRAYGNMEYRRAAKVLAEYNPASQIHLMIARP